MEKNDNKDGYGFNNGWRRGENSRYEEFSPEQEQFIKKILENTLKSKNDSPYRQKVEKVLEEYENETPDK